MRFSGAMVWIAPGLLVMPGVSAFMTTQQSNRLMKLPTMGSIDRSPHSPQGSIGPSVVNTDRLGFDLTTNYQPKGVYPDPMTLIKPPRDGTTAAAVLSETRAHMTDIMANIPSLEDLYSATVTIRRTMQEKEKIYKEVVAKLQDEQDESNQAIEAWQLHYNKTILNLQKQTEEAQQEIKEKNSMYQHHQNEAKQKQQSALEKINWLTQELQTLKVKTQQEQLETNRAAQAKQAELLSRIDDLQASLKLQIHATEEQGAKAEQYLQERIAAKAELTKVQADFERTVAVLEGQLSVEREARAQDRCRAEEQIAKEREEARNQIVAAQQESKAQTTAMANALRAKEEELNRSIQQINDSAKRKENELTNELNRVKADSQQQLASEKDAALKIQSDLSGQIKAKETELREQISLTNLQTTKAQDLLHNRMELERELSALQKKYDEAVTSWQSRCKSLEEVHAKEKQYAQAKLVEEREAARKEIDAALQEAEAQKAALASGLKAMDDKHRVAFNQLQASATEKEKKLHDSLETTNSLLQQVKSESHTRLMSEREAARAKEEGLACRVSEKEKELQEQIARTEEQSAKAGELWMRRMELEKELCSLMNKHAYVISSWEKRYRLLEEKLFKESIAAENLLARKEAEARKEVEDANRKVEEFKAALGIGLIEKDNQHKQAFRNLQESAEKKEKELAENLKRINNELQQLKFESNKTIVAEKEAAMQQALELGAEISKKQQALEDQTELTVLQTAKVGEIWDKRMALEEELSFANAKYHTAVTEWERVFGSQEEARLKEKRASEEFLLRTEAEASVKIEAALQKAKLYRDALESGIKDKTAEHSEIIQKLQHESQVKEETLRASVETITNTWQQYKVDSQQKLLSEKEAAMKKESELTEKIRKTEEELDCQSKLAVMQSSKVDELWRTRTQLEEQVNDMKIKHAGEISDWRTRCASLEEARVRDLQAAEAVCQKKVDAAVAQGEQHKAELHRCLKAIALQESELKEEIERMASMLGTMQSMITNTRDFSFKCSSLP